MTEPQPEPKKSDLPVRAASAVVMITVAGTALWLGGWWWTVFVSAVALGVLLEWWGLACTISSSLVARALWLIAGFIYVGIAAVVLVMARDDSIFTVMILLIAVIATDVGAFFTGRNFGGPKIAAKISPSKTWSGLIGGILAASLSIMIISIVLVCGGFGGCWSNEALTDGPASIRIGALIAIIAQTGDFFESWMKRRAGVKDSGNLIPGHGGLLDRVDGLLAVCFVLGLFASLGALVR